MCQASPPAVYDAQFGTRRCKDGEYSTLGQLFFTPLIQQVLQSPNITIHQHRSCRLQALCPHSGTRCSGATEATASQDDSAAATGLARDRELMHSKPLAAPRPTKQFVSCRCGW
jgi:hypothetical protein